MADDMPHRLDVKPIPVSISMADTLEIAGVESQRPTLDLRSLYIALLAIGLGAVGMISAVVLRSLIGLITNLCFYGRVSMTLVNPTVTHVGLWVVLIPVAGAIVVGIMARYGSKAIRGHGIPEAMETVILKQSKIPYRVTLLKPLSAAISIGTGGPFGAEGPIIATGGAVGSLVGQVLSITADERKTLLAAGAAAGMAATFGAPVAAVLLAVELLLFEFKARSLVPVALACATAGGLRILVWGTAPMFAMGPVKPAGAVAMIFYVVLGALMGVVAAGVTRAVYAVEDGFEKWCPTHWMWWPAIGAVVVGIVGYFAPHTLGVGYDNISAALSVKSGLAALLALAILKWVSWTVSLGTGTSGGTLAPLFTIGSALGAAAGLGAVRYLPHADISVPVAALVGMAAIFAGASRALLTAVVFAFETTLQPLGLVPLLAGCGSAFLVSCMLMRQSIMTEKIARKGIRVHSEYAVDFLDRLFVGDAMQPAVCLKASDTLLAARQQLLGQSGGDGHDLFPVLDEQGGLAGVIGWRDVFKPDLAVARPIADVMKMRVIAIRPDQPLRDADLAMARHCIGHLVVVAGERSTEVVGIVTRSDILRAHRERS